MSKSNAAKSDSNPTASKTPVLVRPPEGLKKFTGDVVGFHDFEDHGPIYGIPRSAKLSDSELDTSKPSAFVIFELIEGCKVVNGTGDEAEEIDAKKGDMVGVWMKGGMRGLKMLCDIPVFMQHTGEKKLKGRPASQDPMKTYDIHIGEGKPKLIPVIEDNRKDSRAAKTFLTAGGGRSDANEDGFEF